MKKLSVMFLILVLGLSMFVLTGCGDKTAAIDDEVGVFNEAEGEDEDVGAPGAAISDDAYNATATDSKYFLFESYGPADNLAYQITGWSTITEGRPTSVIFPDIYNKRAVIGIKLGAFRDDTTITNITFGANLRFIGKRSFCGCTNLTSITYPMVKAFEGKVSDYLPANYNDLTDDTAITAADEAAQAAYEAAYNSTCGITKIAASAFRDCTSLTSFTLPTNCTTISGSLLKNCTSLTTFILNNKITDIGAMAFQGCTGITTVDFSDMTVLASIGACAFKGCTALNSVSLPRKVTAIPVDCFTDCSKLATFTAAGKIKTVELCAFYNCSSLNSITLDSAVTIEPLAFYNCPAGAAYGA